MSASATPFGFRPAQHWSGLDRARPYVIQASYATALYKNQPVALGATTAAGTVITATAGSDFIGVLAGIQYNDITNKPTISPYWPGVVTGATTGPGPYPPSISGAIAWVWDDPYTIFEAQTDGTFSTLANVMTSSAFLQGVIGGQMNFNNLTLGNTQTGLSQSTLAGSTAIITGAANNFRVLEPGEQVDNNFLSDQYVIFQVQAATHQFIANKNAV